MNRDRMEGKTKEATGWMKEKTGEVTGDRDLEAKGETESTEGKLQDAWGKVKGAAEDTVDAVKDKVKR
jgi:uncharacterized protein YjbJ (UPF0337 family)